VRSNVCQRAGKPGTGHASQNMYRSDRFKIFHKNFDMSEVSMMGRREFGKHGEEQVDPHVVRRVEKEGSASILGCQRREYG